MRTQPPRAITFLAMLLTAAQTAPADDSVLDDCEAADNWSTAGEPYGRVTIDAVPFHAKKGERCVRLTFESCQISWIRLNTRVSWDDNEALTFWLRADRRGDAIWSFRVDADAVDNSFAIGARVRLDFDGWQHIRLTRDDFSISVKSGDADVDFSKIKNLNLALMEGCEKPTVYIDDIRYEPRRERVQPATPDIVVLDRCDSAEHWQVDGLNASVVGAPKAQGHGALQLHYEGATSGHARRACEPAHLSPRHALRLHVRGPGVTTSAAMRIVLNTSTGASFTKDVEIVNFEMQEHLIFPAEFQAAANADGDAADWGDIVSFVLRVDNANANDSGNIIVDDICFEKMPSPRPIKAPDPRWWWWDGGFDPFAAMHVIHADWPHLRHDKRPAPIKFSDVVLAPLMPYTVELFADERSASMHVTIMDWEMNVQQVFEAPVASDKPVVRDMIAPPRTGSYIFNAELKDASSETVKTYQTGISVVAKRMREPRGIWGFHGFLGSKGSQWPHHDQVLRMLRDFGVTFLRERVAFDLISADDAAKIRTTPQGKVLELAKSLNMTTTASMTLRNRPDLWGGSGRYGVDGMKPEKRQDVVDTMASIASAYRGLVDYWEVGNEPNEHPIGPYAKVLAACYEGAKRSDPAARIVMGGSHVIDRWQYQAWEIEKQTGVPHQDALATHLYPDPASLEQVMRTWIRAQGDALLDKGMLMTESGWPTFPFKTQSLHRQGLLPEGFSGERESQDWYMRYAPVILGEHMKMGAKLYGVGFFRTTPSMGDWVERDGKLIDLLVHCKGHFVARWNSREISMGRPMAYTHNTIARLLTHEVHLTEVPMIYDKRAALAEQYAFARPGETIVTLWIGVRAGGRAEQVIVTLEVPVGTGLVLAVDMDGNERVLETNSGFVEVPLTRGEPRYVRFLEGNSANHVFVAKHGRDEIEVSSGNMQLVCPDDVREALGSSLDRLYDAGVLHGSVARPLHGSIYVGTPRTFPLIATVVSPDRNLPVISDTVPAPGGPMVLCSPARRAIIVVGQNVEDLNPAIDALYETFFAVHDGRDPTSPKHGNRR